MIKLWTKFKDWAHKQTHWQPGEIVRTGYGWKVPNPLPPGPRPSKMGLKRCEACGQAIKLKKDHTK